LPFSSPAVIEEDDYLKTLARLATAKWETLKGETSFARRGKLQEYLVRKGFEQDRVAAVISDLPQAAGGRPDR
jgi:SOS response regulatory protein OraA/RecX